MKKIFAAAIATMFSAFLSTGAIAAPQDGLILTHWGRWTQEEGERAVLQAARAGAKHVSFLAQLCQKDKFSVEMDWCFSAAGAHFKDSFQAMRPLQLIPLIKQHGMTFSFIPFPMLADGTSRSYLEPEDLDEWFHAYTEKMLELAQASQEWGAPELIVASELTTLFTEDKAWRKAIGQIRKAYKGHLTISALVAQYGAIKFWDALDSIGISAYFPLTAKQDWHHQSVLDTAWKGHKQHLLAFAKKWGKPLTFVEVGYPATNVAALMPWDYQWPKRELDMAQQARCFEAFHNAWAQEKQLRRFQIWGLSGQQPEQMKAFSPIGKPAEAAVKKTFAQRASL